MAKTHLKLDSTRRPVVYDKTLAILVLPDDVTFY